MSNVISEKCQCKPTEKACQAEEGLQQSKHKVVDHEEGSSSLKKPKKSGPTAQEKAVDYEEGSSLKKQKKGAKAMSLNVLDEAVAKLFGCWGKDVYKQISRAKDIDTAHAGVKGYLANGSISVAFSKGQLTHTYSSCPLTKLEIKVEIVQWVAESLCPFKIIVDCGFKMLMKTGCPEFYLPHLSTISCNVWLVFGCTHKRIAKMLQAYEGALSFSPDAWTLEASCHSFVAIIVHLDHNGSPLAMVLDVIKVAENHTDIVLAQVFTHVLNNFGISSKILVITGDNTSNDDTVIDELEDIVLEFNGPAACACCFLHNTNLVAKCLINQFDTSHFNQDEVDDMEAQGIAIAMDMAAHEPKNDKDEEEFLDDEDGIVDGLC
ncbi:hypothetical protein AX14_002749 [Amanita brunnescens Koide BX004]|nr:hypothetical protein AX14_002749 [Amanita brunnescens Koide BX004]